MPDNTDGPGKSPFAKPDPNPPNEKSPFAKPADPAPVSKSSPITKPTPAASGKSPFRSRVTGSPTPGSKSPFGTPEPEDFPPPAPEPAGASPAVLVPPTASVRPVLPVPAPPPVEVPAPPVATPAPPAGYVEPVPTPEPVSKPTPAREPKAIDVEEAPSLFAITATEQPGGPLRFTPPEAGGKTPELKPVKKWGIAQNLTDTDDFEDWAGAPDINARHDPRVEPARKTNRVQEVMDRVTLRTGVLVSTAGLLLAVVITCLFTIPGSPLNASYVSKEARFHEFVDAQVNAGNWVRVESNDLIISMGPTRLNTMEAYQGVLPDKVVPLEGNNPKTVRDWLGQSATTATDFVKQERGAGHTRFQLGTNAILYSVNETGDAYGSVAVGAVDPVTLREWLGPNAPTE